MVALLGGEEVTVKHYVMEGGHGLLRANNHYRDYPDIPWGLQTGSLVWSSGWSRVRGRPRDPRISASMNVFIWTTKPLTLSIQGRVSAVAGEAAEPGGKSTGEGQCG